MINYSIVMRGVNSNLFEINQAKARIKAIKAGDTTVDLTKQDTGNTSGNQPSGSGGNDDDMVEGKLPMQKIENWLSP